jgi:poly-gamma-glutamate synthase PgsB/CapB
VLQKEAERRGSRLIIADPSRVHDSDVSQFNYLSFKDNIALGLSVADILGIDPKTAIHGMIKAKGDIGVVRLQQVALRNKQVIWANLFAVNDRESMVISMEMLESYCDENTIKIGILNNRYDRERRAEQFGDVAVKDLSFDWLITFGAYENLVTRKLRSNNFPAERIVNLGFNVNPSIDQIIETIANMIPDGYQALLVGFVNIHTPQAEMLMEYFEHLNAGRESTSASMIDIGSQRRQRFEMAHR